MKSVFTGREIKEEVKGANTMTKGYDFTKAFANKEKAMNEIQKDLGISYKYESFKEVEDFNKLLTVMGKDNAIKVSADMNEKVGTTTKSANSFAALYLLGNDKETLQSKSDILKIVFKEGLQNAKEVRLPLTTGNNKYKSIVINKLIKDGVSINMVNMDESEEFQKDLMLEMYASLDNLESIDSIILDLVNYHRVYQEKIIDAAKKLYKVFSLFFTMFLRSNSAININLMFTSMKQLEEQVRKGEEVTAADIVTGKYRNAADVGEFKVHSIKSKNIKLTFQDDLAEIQDKAFYGFKDFLINLVDTYRLVGYSTEITDMFFKIGNEFNTVLALHNNVIKPYNTICSEISKQITSHQYALENAEDIDNKIGIQSKINMLNKEREQAFRTLSDIARFITKDLSMVNAGMAMLQASIIKKTDSPESDLILLSGNWYINKFSANRAYENIAPELFMEFIMNIYGEQEAVCKIEGKKSDITSLIDGQKLTFKFGVCNDESLMISLNKDELGDAIELENLETIVRIIDGVAHVAIVMEFDRVVITADDIKNVYVPIFHMDKFITGETESIVNFIEAQNSFKMVSKLGKNSRVITASIDGKESVICRYNNNCIFKGMASDHVKVYASEFSSYMLMAGIKVSEDSFKEEMKLMESEMEAAHLMTGIENIFAGGSAFKLDEDNANTGVESNPEAKNQNEIMDYSNLNDLNMNGDLYMNDEYYIDESNYVTDEIFNQ